MAHKKLIIYLLTFVATMILLEVGLDMIAETGIDFKIIGLLIVGGTLLSIMCIGGKSNK